MILLSCASTLAQSNEKYLFLNHSFVCYTDSVTLQATTDGFFESWSLPEQPSSVVSSKSSFKIGAPKQTMQLVGRSIYKSKYLNINSSFDLGAVGFETDYLNVPKLNRFGRFTVSSTANGAASGYSSYAKILDHTTGTLTGNMMFVDGDTNTKNHVYRVKFKMEKDKYYFFEVWVANFSGYMASPNVDTNMFHPVRLVLELSNGTLLKDYISKPDTTWQVIRASYRATKTDSVSFSIRTGTKFSIGADFVLDDIGIFSTEAKTDVLTIYPCNDTDVFSPDNDGQYDVFHIREPGQARIYDSEGKLIRELTTPAFWDGTNNDGSPSSTGYYAVVLDKGKHLNVTLVR